MIQDNIKNSNSCYIHENAINQIVLPSMNMINRVQDQSDFLMSGQYVSMDMQQHQQQSHQVVQYEQQFSLQQQHVQQQTTFDASLQQPWQQQQQSQQYFYSNNRISSFNSGDCPPTPEDTPPANADNILVMNEASSSDTSTIGDEVKPTQETFAYLQELNSDNLMQFSQQSMLQEMLLKETFHGKPNNHILPTVEEHDLGGYNFQLTTSSQHSKGKTSWNYSVDLNKLYIRMNDTFTVDAVYTPRFPVQPLRLRSFICFVKEVSEPVLRCQNHLSKDTETNAIKRESVLRCDNPNAEYCGSATGNSIKERFSVTVPLTSGIAQSDNSLKQTIAFKFTCQNSCIGRKETCLMFLLEGMNGEILSQRLLNVRICTCPKRDRAHDEKSLKRKNEEEACHTKAKMPKTERISPSPMIKDENSCSDYETSAKHFDLQRTASGGFRLVMEVSTKEIAMSTIDYLMAKESANVVNQSPEAPRSHRNIRKLKRLYNSSKEFH